MLWNNSITFSKHKLLLLSLTCNIEEIWVDIFEKVVAISIKKIEQSNIYYYFTAYN